MLKKTLGVIAIATVLTAAAAAQTRPEKPQPTPKPEPAEQPQPQPGTGIGAPPRWDAQGQAVNVKLELTITDQTGPGEPTRKVITMIVADRQSGYIRSKAAVKVPVGGPGAGGANMFQYRDLPINVDARPTILGPRNEGNIRVDLGLEYQPSAPAGANLAAQGAEPGTSNLNERISVILEPGKPLTISQAADPASDRRISVELKATVLK